MSDKRTQQQLLNRLTRAEAERVRREAALRDAQARTGAALLALVDEVGASEAARLFGISRSALYQRLARLTR